MFQMSGIAGSVILMVMATGWIHHPDFLEHDTGKLHPERPQRLEAITRELQTRGLMDRLLRPEFAAVQPEDLRFIHSGEHVDRVERACRNRSRSLDDDTLICGRSAEIARLASGGIWCAVEGVLTGKWKTAFCAMRPPGHHAERERAMGFCLYNHMAYAADRLVREKGLKRVAIVDFDVHHGNGTQNIFEERSDVLFISVHEDPTRLYPGTGFACEQGRGAGEGFTLNLPLDPGGGDAEYLTCLRKEVEPALEKYQPEFLLVSAGFDAAAEDPLAHMEVTTAGFDAIGRLLLAWADRFCGGRMVSSLEGGYSLPALSAGVAVQVQAMLEAGQT